MILEVHDGPVHDWPILKQRSSQCFRVIALKMLIGNVRAVKPSPKGFMTGSFSTYL